MKRKLLKLILFIAFIWAFLYINNSWLQTSKYEVVSERIPKAFDGVKIVQISDLHDATFGEKQSRLVENVKNLDPDFVFLTGDFIDSNRYDLQNSLNFVKQITPFTDVFYVTGNHEVAVNKIDEITQALKELGVHVLMDESAEIEKAGESLLIAGVQDPLIKAIYPPEEVVAEEIDHAIDKQKDSFKLLLSHRPEVFDVYAEKEIDIVFTGHAHGGQVRIPGVGGLIAPGQGWFPKYTAGMHEQGTTKMVVSRGLGNSIIPYRILNRPEIVMVTLKNS
ncbi:metallophosphoesterase [Lederbergia wuyishanensis]|uniref:MPP superfamily phosphohydrolase n=1 Tax=Lederbergia wuyishanensis TaxID=1347903 RepID=A0ABU0DA34_9BACI|nr:metallophosphoesterase [Lederbergia wuyishanensis]MCJ8008479.1 metallophosphoesterase [Lederbergia wuyishanensis]MDQ0345222.1 putative MPP superfamily phosphohydrolase [Lederbergia wuyishanensis]